MGKIKDLTGQRFGRLVVIEDSGERKQTNVMWLCKCDCGNDVKVKSNNLIRGDVKSCGCLRKDIAKQSIDEYHDKTGVEETNVDQLTSKLSSANTSGVKGVYWIKRRNKWEAAIFFKGEKIYLGYFTSKQDAINARKEAEEKYFKPILEKYGKLSE